MLADLQVALQELASRADGTAELDRALLPRRGDRACRRPPALLLLQPRADRGFPCRLGPGQWRTDPRCAGDGRHPAPRAPAAAQEAHPSVAWADFASARRCDVYGRLESIRDRTGSSAALDAG